MALYLGSDKVKINYNGCVYNLNLSSTTPTLNNVLLLSSDGYVLTDINELYLIPKEDK